MKTKEAGFKYSIIQNKSISKEVLTDTLIKSLIDKKRVKVTLLKKYSKKGIHYFIQQKLQIILYQSTNFPIQKLCNINHCKFYKLKKNIQSFR